MLKDRSLQVKMVKDAEPGQSVDYNQVIDKVTKSVITGILVYVGADTIRRVAVYMVTVKA